MTYLIFGIVVMLVTWGITKEECSKRNVTLKYHNYIKETLLSQVASLEEHIDYLNSELITYKAMKENK